MARMTPAGVFVTPNNPVNRAPTNVFQANPYAIPMGLMNAGIGLMQGAAPSPVPGAASRGFASAAQGLQQGLMQSLQLNEMDRQRQAEQRARDAVAQMGGGPALQALGQAAPLQALQVAAEASTRQPRRFTAVNYYDPDDLTDIRTAGTPEQEAALQQAGFVKGKPPRAGMRIETTPDGGTVVSYGGAPGQQGSLSGSTTSKLQQEVLGKELLVDQLNLIEGRLQDEYLTYQGAGKAAVQEILNKAGMSEAQFAAERGMFASDVQSFFNQYRKEITGAAASILEMRDIGKAIPSLNDSPAVFRAKLQATRDWAAYVADRQRAALEEGITPRRGNKEYEEWAEQYAKTNPRPEVREASIVGGDVADPASLTPQTISEMPIRDLEALDLNALSEEALDALLERLQ